MEIHEGKISNLRESLSFNEGTSIYTYHFRVANQPVSYTSHQSLVLDDGDFVTVAGKTKSGMFKVYAYNNHSAGVVGSSAQSTHCFIGGVVGIVMALVVLSVFSSPFFGAIPYAFAACFLGLGVVYLVKGIKIKSAIDSVLNQVDKRESDI
ncbi:hypothetical protein SBW85_03295 [Vibrio plantisponsor]|uniref:Uncharacterized protein n=1 Tax=Vibrio plantisponsor TaxID=664643 RepID=A0ABU4IEZ0_9VIBR|nr:hypothetical protein [Vibrio plantisponsor]MDW6016794.1 hypothetical protein [Vibrio plantisponsor]NNM39835.1 hypothetical protein [Vibrio plantisponsor]